MNNWVSYQNGNYTVYINTENGTKIRKNDLDYFEPEWPESADIKITNCCKHGCSMCHENSTKDGAVGDIMSETEKITTEITTETTTETPLGDKGLFFILLVKYLYEKMHKMMKK